jgi:hypothetical protein
VALHQAEAEQNLAQTVLLADPPVGRRGPAQQPLGFFEAALHPSQ